MRVLILVLLGLPFAMPSIAKDGQITAAQRATIGCLDAMGKSTTWGQCINLMFAPCEGEAVGTAAHVACLTAEHDAWREAMDAHRLALIDTLSPMGVNELAQIMGHWFGYVAEKCAQVAAGKPPTASEAARTGCEISEIASVLTEFVACREGRSTAPYCVMRK